MTKIQIAEAKSHFSEVLRGVEAGGIVQITRGRNKRPIAYIVSAQEYEKPKKRELGTLEHWGKITLGDDWKMTAEELVGA